MNLSQDILFEERAGQGGDLGIIILNRPAALNALNHGMIQAMHTQLETWATQPSIKAVVIRAAEGRAFCAGGDLRSTYDRFRNHDASLPHFFRDEYQLNRLIFHFPKPYIALLDGITMGGGVGISIHGSHRVATDRLLFAMPETGIGFFPDVGGTYFLPRLPGATGYYLGLTGARLASDDCVALGIAQCKVARDALPALIDALAQTPFGTHANAAVTKVLDPFQVACQPSAVLTQRVAIDHCFSAHTVEAIWQALRESSSLLCQEAAVTLLQKSPTSLKVTLQALQDGQQLDFDACMQQEFRLVCRFLQGHDFIEGIRAVIVDKDQTPHWQPSALEHVTAEEVAQYFSPVSQELV